MGQHLILFVLTSALLFCISNAIKCKYYDHACLGGNGKRSAMGETNLLKILAQEFPAEQPQKRNSLISNDDVDDYETRKLLDQVYGRSDLSPTIKRLAKLILPDETQK